MKAMKKAMALGLALAMVVTAVPVTDAQAATGVAKSKNYYVGKTYTLKLTTPKTWKSVSTKWTTSKSSVAKLTSKKAKSVKVTAVKKGTATVTAKVTYKKSGKKSTKTYKCKLTVKNSSIKMASTATVDVGSKVSVAATVAPKSAVPSLTYVSSDESVATVNAAGEVTGVKAGEAVITATMKCGTVKKTAKTTVTVKAVVAELSAVKQTASNAFTATFTADASKTFTKEDIKVSSVDGAAEFAVKTVEYSADGLTAKVTLFNNFTNATAYKVVCGEKNFEFTAQVGEVSRVVINTASAEKNVETSIDFTLFDAAGIDVTPSVALDTTCYVTINGSYSAASIDKPSKATITMDTVGDKADVTVTYNSNVAGAQDISATQTITCTDPKAVQGTKLFAQTTNKNTKSQCAKFYLGLSSDSVTVTEGGSETVFFCAKDAKGNVISYDEYDVESSNDAIANATMSAYSGKFAEISVSGNTLGNATLNIKATKNGKDSFYTIPVTVVKEAELASMTVTADKTTMSNVKDEEYKGTLTINVLDQKGQGMSTCSVECELVDTSLTNKIVVNSPAVRVAPGVYKATYSAVNASEGRFTIKVTAADNRTGKTIERRVGINVKDINKVASEKGGKLPLTYQIELDNKTVDLNPSDTWDDNVTAKLYATYNGMFAGYVRSTSGAAFSIGDADSGINAKDAITGIEVGVKYGTTVYSDSKTLYGANDGMKDLCNVVNATTSAAITFNAVDNSGVVVYHPEGSNTLARTGLYTIRYEIKEHSKNTPTVKSQTFTVKNTMKLPTVTVDSRVVDSITNYDDIIKNLSTDVDMNNNISEHESISIDTTPNNTCKVKPNTNGTAATVKYVIVEDTYDGTTWNFYVPINATFRIE